MDKIPVLEKKSEKAQSRAIHLDDILLVFIIITPFKYDNFNEFYFATRSQWNAPPFIKSIKIFLYINNDQENKMRTKTFYITKM